jgi:hypothetical protein
LDIDFRDVICKHAEWIDGNLVWFRCPVCGSIEVPSDFWWFQSESLTDPLESYYGCNHNRYPKLNGKEELERLQKKYG